MQFIVSVKEVDAVGQTVISQRTVVYADSELEAKVQGATMMGVDQSLVTVTALGDTGMAPNSRVYETRDQILQGLPPG